MLVSYDIQHATVCYDDHGVALTSSGMSLCLDKLEGVVTVPVDGLIDLQESK